MFSQTSVFSPVNGSALQAISACPLDVPFGCGFAGQPPPTGGFRRAGARDPSFAGRVVLPQFPLLLPFLSPSWDELVEGLQGPC